ncbi:MAG: FAD-dependent oxidoreductase [Mangrovibacterium sp.]
MNSKKKIITIGGGPAGSEVSSVLAGMGYEVTLLEKSRQPGGKLNRWSNLFPTGRPAGEIRSYLSGQLKQQNFLTLTGTAPEKLNRASGRFELQTRNGQQLQADALVISTGFEIFDASRKEEYGYTIYENVISSVDLEEMLRKQQPVLTSRGKPPGRIAFIHCVGSRDEKAGHHHCSRVCCITGVKQATELAGRFPGAEIFCFYMDLRMFGLSWEARYREAQEKYNVQFIRGRLSEVSENQDESLLIKAEDTLSGRPLKMNVDLVVLLVGMIPGTDTNAIARMCRLEKEPNGFLQVQDPHLYRNRSSQEGIFLAGSCTGPMSLNETLEHARSAALDVHAYLQKPES